MSITQVLASQFAFAHGATLRNLDGISDAEAEMFPQPAGNSINWIAGHVLVSRERLLSRFGHAGSLPPAAVDYYVRGAKPSGKPPVPLAELKAGLVRSQEALQNVLATVDEATLAAAAPFSPLPDPNETILSLLGKFVIHDSYHSGQMGIARRLLGKEGAIA